MILVGIGRQSGEGVVVNSLPWEEDTKGAIIRNLAVRASYKILGCRRGVLFLIWLRKMIDYCENNIPRTPVGNKL